MMRKVSKSEMAELDEKVTEKYGISAEALMENAGYQVADFLRQEFSEDVKIAFICGQGNNGGDGFAAARRLVNWGYTVQVFTPYEKDVLSDLGLKQLQRLEKIDEDIIQEDFPTANIYVDALLGYGIEGRLRDPVDNMVRRMNKWSAEIVSIDVSTGVEVDSGEVPSTSAYTDYTVTLGLPKKGLNYQNSGKILLADVGIPPQATEEIGVDSEKLFYNSSRIELRELDL